MNFNKYQFNPCTLYNLKHYINLTHSRLEILLIKHNYKYFYIYVYMNKYDYLKIQFYKL